MKGAKLYLMSNKFGDLVRIGRLEKGWSQRELARRIGKSATYIHYVERGFNPASKTDVLRVGEDAVDEIARILGLDKDEARIAAGYAPANATVTPRNLPELIAALERLGIEPPMFYGGLPDPGEEAFQEVIERIWLDINLVLSRHAKGRTVTHMALPIDDVDIEDANIEFRRIK